MVNIKTIKYWWRNGSIVTPACYIQYTGSTRTAYPQWGFHASWSISCYSKQYHINKSTANEHFPNKGV